MGAERLRVERVTVRRHDDDQHVDVIRGVGFRATNGTDWHGPTRVVRQDAVRDILHRRAGLEPRGHAANVTEA